MKNTEEVVNKYLKKVQNTYFMQRGGIVKDNIPTFKSKIIDIKKEQTPKEFYEDYLQSENYKKRLIGMGDTTPNETIKVRTENLKTLTVTDKKPFDFLEFVNLKEKVEDGSYYDPSKHEVYLNIQKDIKDTSNYFPYKGMKTLDVPTVESHEMSHAIRKDSPLNFKENFNFLMRKKEADYKNPHDAKPEENKADLDAYRFLLKKDGVYDTGKEEFTKEILNKKDNYFPLQRLKKRYSDENIIWLMNNIAQNNQESPTVAQQGGKIKK